MEKTNLDYLKDFIDESILEKLRDNVKELFPVQKNIIPLLVNQFNNLNLTRPHDVCVSSPTGSGKTYTFCLPIIQFLLKFVTKELRVLVILPTNDLASQVLKVFQQLCNDLKITVASAIGNRSLETDLSTIFLMDKNKNFLKNKAEILIATPGKLMELIIKIPEFSLKHVQVLVIDEVDRILNSELEHDWIDNLELSLYDRNSNLLDCACSIKENAKFKYSQFNGCSLTNYSSSKNVIKLLFSATLNNDKTKLDNLHLFEPLYFTFSTESILEQKSISRFELPKTLTQRYVNVQNDYKPAMIYYLMKNLNYRKVICFIGRKEDAHRLFLLLSEFGEFNVFELSSQIDVGKRDKLKNDFSDGKIDLIICTDILARGIDLQDVNCVINYEPPQNAQAYVHRVGRTARAGKEGTSITLVDMTEKQRFSIIARKTVGNRKLINFKLNYNQKVFKEICDRYLKHLETLKNVVNVEKKKKKRRKLKTVNNLKSELKPEQQK